MKGLLFAAQVEGIRSRKDKTVSVVLGTQELSPQKAGELFSTNGHLVTCYLSVKEHISDSEKDIIDSVETPAHGKTPSQRMRSVIFRMWEQDNEGYTDKNLHYLHWMDKMIDHLKTNLK
jgi:hypothetical protein